jgi:flagellar biosynthesis regulator FlaF
MLLQAEIRMQGMIAENKQREILGQSIAYGEKEFVQLIEDFGVHHNSLISELRGY